MSVEELKKIRIGSFSYSYEIKLDEGTSFR